MKFYFELKRYFIFLGELEVYDSASWEHRRLLIEKHGPLLTACRAYRKLKWIKKNFKNSNSVYHKAKSLRAFYKTKAQVNAAKIHLSKYINGEFEFGIPLTRPLHLYFYDQKIIPAIYRNHLKAQFLLVTEIGYNYFEFKGSTLKNVVLPVAEFEFIEYQSLLRTKSLMWNASDSWLEKVQLKIDFCNKYPENFQDIPIRMKLHLEDTLVTNSLVSFIQSEEDEIFKKSSIVVEKEIALWMNNHILSRSIDISILNPPSFKSDIPHQAPGFASPGVISFYGPLLRRFGALKIIAFCESMKSADKKILIEIAGFSDSTQQRDVIRELILNLSRHPVEFKFVDFPSGLIWCPYSFNLIEERNWITAANSFGLPVCTDMIPNLPFEQIQRI